MATVYKPFLNDDVTSTRTLLHESIPVTGTIVSGTYGTFGSEGNIKNYSHKMFQSVYDYPYLSSSSNHIFDLTCGYSSESALSGASTGNDQDKKIAVYNQMAQVLVGHDVSGNIRRFDADGDLSTGTKHDDVFFVNFSRLLSKDEMKKGTFSMTFMTGAFATPQTNLVTISDTGAASSYKTNSPAGEYGILKNPSDESVGLVYYQAGVAVLTASVLEGSVAGFDFDDSGHGVSGSLTGSDIQTNSDNFRHHLYDISFNNTTELNSTIYFCRVNHNEYNYSANPTYTSGSKVRVKNNTIDNPVSYITTVGLYSADNELLAVAKLSEPLKKDPTNEMILRVRLDY